MIRSLGELIGQTSKAQTLVAGIEKAFSEIQPLTRPLRTAYFIWRKPWMTVGGDTFIHDMLQRCGFTNLFADQSRYPTIDPARPGQLRSRPALLRTLPLPGQTHLKEIQTLLPNAIVRLVDGELFSWYGSRLLQAPAYFQRLLTDCHMGLPKKDEL